MAVVGIVCEYNPLHLGHRKQLRWIRQTLGEDTAIVCLMSGNFVQRGAPAIVEASLRAEAALRCGADLVLELPVNVSLSSAEGFAAGGVRILSGFCTHLCFGAETADRNTLVGLAQAMLVPGFRDALRLELDKGLSFPAARQSALESQGQPAQLLQSPNNILAVEYCKAILSQGSRLIPLVLHRPGSYHALDADPENPSATALRCLMTQGKPWEAYIPKEGAISLEGASLHTLSQGEKAILSRLRTMTDAEFEALPYGSEGLWRKLMHAAREKATLEDILTAVKSKRYTRSRLDRMVLCAFLGITQEVLTAEAPWVRVLGLSHRGREVLKAARQTGAFPNLGEAQEHPWQALEHRCQSLYGLFADPPEPPAPRRHPIYITANREDIL